MRLLLFFLIMLPFAGAVKVAPAVIGSDAESVLVVNALNESATYRAVNGNPEQFELAPGERMVVEVEHGWGEKTLYIDEITGSNIVSSAAIPIVPEKSMLNLFDAGTGLPLRAAAICALGGLLAMGGIWWWRKRRR